MRLPRAPPRAPRSPPRMPAPADTKRPRVAATATAAAAGGPLSHSVVDRFVVPGVCVCERESERERGVWAVTISSLPPPPGQPPLPPGLHLTDHVFTVPLDHAAGPTGGVITLFAREVASLSRAGGGAAAAAAAATPAARVTDAPPSTPEPRDPGPYLLYLQGGPGFEAPRPTDASSWLKAATSHFRVILLDQRGTGRSTPVTASTLESLGTVDAQASYLAHFRADAIVADAEAVRSALVPRDGPTRGRWSVLGQSFGGFCAVTYLSLAPRGLTEVLLTGGLPPDAASPCAARAVYAALFDRAATQSAKFYARYPGDVAIVAAIVKLLAAAPGGGVPLPSGGTLTPRALQTLGLACLGSGGGFDRLHYLLERAFEGGGGAGEGGGGRPRALSRAFLKSFEAWMPWDTNPLYATLHEPIYANGPGTATSWAAQAERDARDAQFDALAAVEEGRPVLFTGECVFPWMFDDVASLRPFKAVANALASKSDWSTLYSPPALASARVPVAAATFYDDLYVDFNLAQKTLTLLGPSARQWVTNELMHSAIRDDGARVFDALMGLVRGSVPLF